MRSLLKFSRLNQIKHQVEINTKEIKRKLVYSLPVEYYIDNKYYEIEKKKLLGTSWQLISHENLLNTNENSLGPITYMTETIAGYPLIITKNHENNSISGFLNICRHRAGPLEWDGTAGTCKLKGFTCKYHGWTFNLDGQLKGLPYFGSQEGLNKNDFNLWPIRIARWRGLLFAQIIPNTDNIKEMNGKLIDDLFINDNKGFCNRLKDIPLEDFKFHSTQSHKINCNWKVYAENYLEGYHIPNMHPKLNSMIDMKEYKVLVNIYIFYSNNNIIIIIIIII